MVNYFDSFQAVVMLFVGAIALLLTGLIPIYEQVEYHWFSQSAKMFSSDPIIQRAAKHNQNDALMVTVIYQTDSGAITVNNKRIRPQHIGRLAAGEGIPIKYVTYDHHSLWYENEKPESPIVWLIVAVLALMTAMYALRLFKSELKEGRE